MIFFGEISQTNCQQFSNEVSVCQCYESTWPTWTCCEIYMGKIKHTYTKFATACISIKMDVKSGSMSKHCRTTVNVTPPLEFFISCSMQKIMSCRTDTIWDWLNDGTMLDFWVYYAFKFIILHGHCRVSNSGSQTCFVHWLRETEADLSPSCLRNKEWPGTGQNLINTQSCNRTHYLILKSLWRLYKTVQVCLRAQVSFCPSVLWVPRCNTVPTSAVVWKKRA